MCSRNYQKKKKKELPYSKGGGGGDGAGGRVRVCQVNVTRITRKVFEILNFVFGNLSFVFRSPYSYRLFTHGAERKTRVVKLDPWSKS